MIYLLNRQLLRFDAYNLISDLLFLRYTYPTRSVVIVWFCLICLIVWLFEGGELLLLVGILIIVAVWTGDYRAF